ncbi:MAG: alanine--glyoxylate aminotransferase family protein [Lachnospiraceae bacterium]|nr:alanine--glyoxylate aminotransferase family protein [Lachnospiraceae bacterium]
MLNFTVGPVMSPEYVLDIGAGQLPYFRTAEFSQVMFENEALIKEFAEAGEGSRAIFLTGSGSASMEAAVINTLTAKDKAIVVNGGSFGDRFAKICSIHHIPFEQINPEKGCGITEDDLASFEGRGFTAFLVNICETSTGVLYDMELISRFCKRNGLFLIADAVSAFLADPIDMDALGIDVMTTASQKALACPPGISAVVLSARAVERVMSIECGCMYLDLKDALKNAERGQTPFTPAVGTLLQINARLQQIKETGGVDAENARIASLCADFRSRLSDLPFRPFCNSPSNCVTALTPSTVSAYELFLKLKDEYGIWICPNGGELRDRVFRVGHIGALSTKDNEKLVSAFKDLKDKGFF